ncbi:MAG: tetratricopeptide repeat protein [Acidobacteria bacterium]|nr:tetratricopeptide repeat protein [Acidobacteriota bacterium]
MSTQLSQLIGSLLQTPGDESTLAAIRSWVEAGPGGSDQVDGLTLLEGAAGDLGKAGRWAEAMQLLDVALPLAEGKKRAELLAGVARIEEEALYDVKHAATTYRRVLELDPDHAVASEAVQRLEKLASEWKRIVERFEEEAAGESEPALKSQLYLRIAGLIESFGGKQKDRISVVVGHLQNALRANPANHAAVQLLIRVMGRAKRLDDLAPQLVQLAGEAKARDEKVALLTEAGKAYARLEQPEKAARLYQEVLDFVPGHASALSYLVDYYTAIGDSDHLVALYEDALRSRPKGESELELLFQIGMVHWKMRKNSAAAEEYFRRIRKTHPAHPAALNFYRQHCEELGDFARLLQILLEAQRAAETDDERVRFLKEVAELAESKLKNDERAIEAHKGILKLRPGDAQAVAQLKRLYEKTEKWNALIDVLKGEVAATEGATRAAVLEEMVAVYRDRLRSEMMVIKTWLQVLELDPLHEGAFAALRDVFTQAGRWNDLIALLSRRAEAVAEVPAKVALYREIASVWTQRLNNLNNAVKPLEMVRQLDPRDAETNALLKDIYTRRRAFGELYELLLAELPDLAGEKRVEQLVQLAQLAGERLDKRADAIRMWWEIRELAPGRTEAFDTIERLAERAKDYEEVAKVVQSRIDAEADDKARVNLWTKLASIFQERLHDPKRAADAYQQILKLQPGHAKATRMLKDSFLAAGDYVELEKLYESQSDWEGLVESLGVAADRSEDRELRIRLSLKAAQVYEEKIGQPERAFRAYERVLEVDAGNRKAADALARIYEGQEDWKALVRVLTVLVGLADGAQEKLALGRRLMDLYSERIREPARAFEWARQCYALAPTDGDAVAALELYAEELKAFEELLRLFEARLPEAGGDEKVDLWRRIAGLQASRLGDIDAAIETYRKLLRERPAAVEAVQSLETLLQSSGKLELLAGFYRERLAESKDDAQRLAWLVKLAALLDEGLDRSDDAVETYLEVLKLDADQPAALDALERIYGATNRSRDLAAILRRKRSKTEGEARRALTFRLGQLYAGPLADEERAIESFREVLDGEPGHAESIAALEVYLGKPKHRLEVAKFLEPQFLASNNFPKLAWVLQVIAEGTPSGADRLELLKRLVRVYDEALGDQEAAFAAVAEAVAEYPDEEPLWDDLDRLAGAVNRRPAQAKRLEEVYESKRLTNEAQLRLARRLAVLCDEGLAERKRAEPYHRFILQHDADDAASFAALDALLKSEERYEELSKVLRARADRSTQAQVRVEMLQQLAFVLEDMLEKPAEAIATYRELRDVQPENELAIKALERLLEAGGKWEELCELLEQTLGVAQFESEFDRRLRIAQLREQKLGQQAAALDDYRQLLAQRGEEPRLTEALERLLAAPSLRQDVADILSPLYEKAGRYADLVRVLQVKLEAAAAAADKVLVWTRIAQIREDALTDLDGAFEAWSQAVEADPADPAPRRELARISDAQGLHALHADVLEEVLEKVGDDSALRAELLGRLAAIYDDALGDVEKAEKTYRRWLDVDRDDPAVALPAATRLERILAARERHADLVEVLRIQARFADSGERRVELLRRVAEIQESFLGNAADALATVQEIDELAPQDAVNLLALERLFHQTGKWAELVDVLRRRSTLAAEPAERRAIAYRIAEILEEKLKDRDEAIVAYQGILSDAPAEGQAVRALIRLFEASGQWSDLLDALRRLHDLTTDAPERVAVLCRMGEVQRERTKDLPDAVDSYRRALELEPAGQVARTALEKLADEPDVRLVVARILSALYRQEGQYPRLVAMLDIEIAEAEDDVRRTAALRQAAEVAELGLSDSRMAFGYAGRALRLTAGSPEAAQGVAEVERLAAATTDLPALATLLREVAPDILDVGLQTQVFRRVADLAKDERQYDTATEYYTKVLDNDPSHAAALDALEQVHAATEHWTELLEVFRRKAELAQAPQDKVSLLLRQGELCEDKLADRSSAVACYEAVLEVDSRNESATRALERLYAEAERWSPLVDLVERQLGWPGADAIALHVRAADVVLEKLGDPPRAFDHFRAALELDPAHAATIARLEGLLREGDVRGAAADVLEDVYRRRMELQKLVEVLLVKHELLETPEERKEVLRRVGQLYEEQLENLDQAFVVYGRLFREDVEDAESRELVERLAGVMSAWGRLADLYEAILAEAKVDTQATAAVAYRLGEVVEEKLRDFPRARAAYRRAHAYDQADAQAMAALERVFAATEDWPALIELLRQVADATYDPAGKKDLLFRMAAILEEKMEQRNKAIDVYAEVLDVDPADPRAIAALDRLYYYEKRWPDLADLLVRQVEQAADERSRNALRYRLAMLFQEQLADVERAVGTLEEILRSDPTFREAISAMESLMSDPDQRVHIAQSLIPVYQQLDDWESLIQVYQVELEALQDTTERILRWLEIARLYEAKGRDQRSAFRAYGAAFAEDPSDQAVLEQIQRLATSLGTWTELVSTIEAGIQKLDDGGMKADLLRLAARTLDRRLGDFRGAVSAYERLLKLEPADLEAIDGLDALLTLLAEWGRLIEVLDLRADMVGEPGQQKAIRTRQGSICEEQLGKPDDAVAFYRKALDLDETDLALYDAIAALLERRERDAELVELLERKLTVLSDPAGRREALAQIARTRRDRLHDAPAAITAFRSLLEESPGDREALDALDALLLGEKSWYDLAEVLAHKLDAAASDPERLALRLRLGQIARKETEDVPSAIEHFEHAVALAPDSEEAIAALNEIGKDEEHRLRVFDILEPVLRHRGRWQDLLDLRELRLQAIADPVARVEELGNIADLLERALGRPADAFAAHLRAVREEAPSPAAIEAAQRLAVQLDRWADLSEALGVKAKATADAQSAGALWLLAGNIAEAQIDDVDRAVAAYRAALDAGAPEAEPLEALDRLYTRLERWDALLEVLERKMGAAPDPATQSRLELRVGRIRLERYQDVPGTISAMRNVLERTPDDVEATTALEALWNQADQVPALLEILGPVYRARNEGRKLLDLMDLRVQGMRDAGDRVTMLREMAEIAEDQLHDPARGFLCLSRAFETRPEEAGLLEDVERLGEVLGAFAQLVELGARTVEKLDEPSAKVTLLLRCGRWSVRLGDPGRAVEFLRAVLALEPEHEEALHELETLLGQLGRHAELADVVEKRAAVVFDLEAKKGLYRALAALCVERLGDAKRAASAYDRILEADESDLAALDAVLALRERLEEWPTLAELLGRRISATVDAAQATALRKRLAGLYLGPLGREDDGVAALKEILDYQPDDAETVTALEDFYSRHQRWDDLRDLLRDRLDRATESGSRLALLERLSDLAETKLDAPQDALDFALQMLDVEKASAQGRGRVERLLAALKRWDDLVMYFETWVKEAEGRDAAEELRLLVKIGEVREREMDDPDGAAEYFEKVLAREPNHTMALGALARIHERKGDWAKCVEVLERAAAGGGAPADVSDVLLRLGKVKEERLKEVPGALYNYQQAVQAHPENKAAVDAVVALARSAGEWPTYAAYAEYGIRFLTDDKEKLKALLDLSQVQTEKLGDAAKALQLVEAASTLAPDDRGVLMAMCDLMTKAGRTDEAIPILEKLVAAEDGGGKRRGKDAAVYLERLAAALEAKGDLTGAKSRLEEASRVDVTNVRVAYRLGLLYKKEGDSERAGQKLRPLLLQKIEPSSGVDKADVYFHLAELHVAKGEKPKALSMIDRGLQASPQHEGLKALKEKVK